MNLDIQIPIDHIHKALQEQGLRLIRQDQLDFYTSIDPAALMYSVAKNKNLIAPYLPHSKSQLGQDLFALLVSGSAEPNFFVEFGATDGLSLSNTYLLETQLGWNGILAEPAKRWHNLLQANRKCHIDTRCVSQASGNILNFLETESAELSSLEAYADNDHWGPTRSSSTVSKYTVETISLNDLLDEHNAPTEIAFMSIDTEGSELDILRSFDFCKRKIKSLCVEHNFRPHRQEIHSLLVDNGFKRVLETISKWDDWYINVI